MERDDREKDCSGRPILGSVHRTRHSSSIHCLSIAASILGLPLVRHDSHV